MSVRAISLGAGVQSTALVVLAAQREIDYRLAIFANVGANSENPETLAYLDDHLKPYMKRHGIEFVEVWKDRDGEPDTVLDDFHRRKHSIGIPMRVMPDNAPLMRSCTHDFKIRPVGRELKRRGASRDNPATVALGISIDEYQRMRTSPHDYQINDYPLIEARMNRRDCEAVIVKAGLPVPGKSSCRFCPHMKRAEWLRMATENPALFAEMVEMEREANRKVKGKLGGPVHLSSTGASLDRITEQPLLLGFDDISCDIAGYCHS